MMEVNDELTALIHEAMPFGRELELRVVAAEPSRVVGTVKWAARNCTVGGALHGGYLMGIADVLGATCAGANLPGGATTTTIESKTNFFRPIRAGVVTLESIPIHVGRTTIVVQTDIRRQDGKLTTRTLQTQAVLGP
ncbi:MAG: PaaI family thioesterase [Myxococcales bacterium]|nr:PaaI family thioesterase [Myxococcales bacterium]